MVPNYRLLASLFILNIATSLYARQQTQPTDDNEAKNAEAASSPPALSTGSDFSVNFDKLTEQNDFNKGQNENDIAEDDDNDRIWIISDDNVDEVLNDTLNIRNDETNNYELTNPKEEINKSPQLADIRKNDETANKQQSKTKKKTNTSTNTITTIEPEEIEIEENIDNTNPLKSEIHAYNTVNKQENQVLITFLNDRENKKKSNDVTSYKNKGNSSVNTVLQKILNLLSKYVVGTSKNTAPREILAVLKDQQKVGEIPISAINDSKGTDTLANNVDRSNRYPEKSIKTEDENIEESDVTNDLQLQTITTIEKMQAAPSGSKFIDKTIIQNDPVLPRNLLTIINSGSIEDMQAIVPLEGHNLIFNDKTINPGIHIVTANVTNEEYMQSVADMISTISFEKKADIKVLGKKAKKRLVKTLIKSIKEGMILIINSGSINGLSLKLSGTDKPTSEESTTKNPALGDTAETLDNKMITKNLNLKKTTQSETTTVTSQSLNTDAVTSPSTEITSQNPETEVITPNTNIEITANTLNTEITSTKPNTERAIIDQNPKGEITSNNPSIRKNTTNCRSNKLGGNNNTSKNINNELTTEHSNCNDTSKNFHASDNTNNEILVTPINISLKNNCSNLNKDERTDAKYVIENSDRVNCDRQSNTEVTSENTKNSTEQEITDNAPQSERNIQNQNNGIVTEHPGSDRLEIKSTDQNLDHKIYELTEVVKTTDSETKKENKDDHINDHFSKTNGKIFKKDTLWHINYILPHNLNLDKRIYGNSHNVNNKNKISNKNSLSNITIGNTTKNNEIRNNNRKNNIENTETGNNETDTSGHRVKRGMASYFPVLGLLKHVNDGKKIKDLMLYLQRLLDFTENSDEENANQSFKREFYDEEEELVPINTKF